MRHRTKITIFRLLACSMVGYALVHPIIMVISFLMTGKPSSLPSPTATALIEQIAISFSIPMLPWSLSFALLGGLIGFFYDKNIEVDEGRMELILQLQTSLDEIKKLSGLIPICASCKNIRDDKGFWTEIEIYIKDHSEADFTHGICPECAKTIYPAYKGIKSNP